MKLTFEIASAMSDVCAQRIKRAVDAVPQVRITNVDRAQSTLSVESHTDVVHNVRATVTELGYVNARWHAASP